MISLGISCNGSHDSAACIIQDGKILFGVAEERLSRRKHDGTYPWRAIQACLSQSGIAADAVDFACIDWPRPGENFRTDLRSVLRGDLPRSILRGSFATARKRRQSDNGFDILRAKVPGFKGRCFSVPHHLAHAISAYAYSGFSDASVVVIDGRGSWEATSIWHGRDGRLEHIHTIPFPNSLGQFYAGLTYQLGFEPYSDEWKVMGLAPYGKPGIRLDDAIQFQKAPYTVAARSVFDLLYGKGPIAARLGARREPESELLDKHKDLSFAVQDSCEQAMMAVVKMAVERTGSRNLAMAGGVALNSKANGKLEVSGLIDRIFVQPAAADDGGCLGAALYPHLENGGRLPVHEMRTAYFGNRYTEAEIEKVLIAYKLPYTRPAHTAAAAARMVADGKIIGWFQGGMEFGPRALGHRSIIADPRDPAMKVKVNNIVKFREDWRPFAPSLLKEYAAEYLESAHDSPFMILTAKIRPEKRAVIPAITHVDDTARPQTVEKVNAPEYWELIDEFRKITGVPVVMNTSFNLRGEPIVTSPTDAIRTFYSCGMEALFLGPFCLSKS